MTDTSEPTGESGDRDFAFYETMNAILLMAAEHIELSRHAAHDVLLGAHLRIASRTLRCALEIYHDRLKANEAQLREKQ